ncbi:MerR family transcriptional regulator [Saccharomonospora sp. NPDC006951]
MAYSIVQVAKLANVTSRTLRHYDEIGLLPPAFTGGNGYRYYEDEQLLLLQRILVLRELGLGLDAVKSVVTKETDQLSALRAHHATLLAERDRFDRLARTVEHTITQLEGGKKVKAEDLYKGFDRHSQEAQTLAEEADQQWPGALATHERVKGWSKEKWEAIQQQGADAWSALAELMAEGVAADDPRTVAATDAHYRWICHSWTPNKEAYIGLGNLYADDERYRVNVERGHPGLADYLRDAMTAYAKQRLD